MAEKRRARVTPGQIFCLCILAILGLTIVGTAWAHAYERSFEGNDE